MQVMERSILSKKYQQMVSEFMVTDFGHFHIVTSEAGIVYAGWTLSEELKRGVQDSNGGTTATEYVEMAKNQLSKYFAGQLQHFSLPIIAHGTPFQESVWAALNEIPYGATWSYQNLATAIGRPQAVRAVGQANRANRIAVIVPCHRVIGASGKLVGYSGNMTDLKEQLLRLESQSVALADG